MSYADIPCSELILYGYSHILFTSVLEKKPDAEVSTRRARKSVAIDLNLYDRTASSPDDESSRSPSSTAHAATRNQGQLVRGGESLKYPSYGYRCTSRNLRRVVSSLPLSPLPRFLNFLPTTAVPLQHSLRRSQLERRRSRRTRPTPTRRDLLADELPGEGAGTRVGALSSDESWACLSGESVRVGSDHGVGKRARAGAVCLLKFVVHRQALWTRLQGDIYKLQHDGYFGDGEPSPCSLPFTLHLSVMLTCHWLHQDSTAKDADSGTFNP